MPTPPSPHRCRSLQLLLPTVIAALPGLVPAQTWQVTITDLGVLPGGFGSSARAINDTGKIVGLSGPGQQTVEWVNGQISVLPVPGLGATSVPTDVNDAGEIAGYYSLGGQRLGIYWNAQGNPVFLPDLPGGSVSTTALAINNSGLIVGKSTAAAPTFGTHGVIWLGSSFQTDLGFAGTGTGCIPSDINDAGVVVGLAGFSSTVVHAFRWQAGQFTNLGTWPGAGAATDAYAINNAGTIVGKSSNVASVWKNGVVTALPMPPGVSAYTAAIDINDAGDIIATGGVPFEVGVLWRNGQPINLGTLPGGTISRVFRINEAGEIVGEANDANGFFRAVKWTVTPASNGWTNLGQGQVGTNGTPVLTGSGSLAPAVPIQWSLANAKDNAPALFVVGLSQTSLPLFGGVLVPTPDAVLLHVTSGAGTASQSLTLTQALPPGQQVTVQTWLLDSAGGRRLGNIECDPSQGSIAPDPGSPPAPDGPAPRTLRTSQLLGPNARCSRSDPTQAPVPSVCHQVLAWRRTERAQRAEARKRSGRALRRTRTAGCPPLAGSSPTRAPAADRRSPAGFLTGVRRCWRKSCRGLRARPVPKTSMTSCEPFRGPSLPVALSSSSAAVLPHSAVVAAVLSCCPAQGRSGVVS